MQEKKFNLCTYMFSILQVLADLTVPLLRPITVIITSTHCGSDWEEKKNKSRWWEGIWGSLGPKTVQLQPKTDPKSESSGRTSSSATAAGFSTMPLQLPNLLAFFSSDFLPSSTSSCFFLAGDLTWCDVNGNKAPKRWMGEPAFCASWCRFCAADEEQQGRLCNVMGPFGLKVE